MRQRYERARSPQRAGDLRRAAVEYQWVWTNSKDLQEWGAVRGSFFAPHIAELVRAYPPARAYYVDRRDEVEPQVRAPSLSSDIFDEWLVLNRILGEERRTFEWFDAVKGDPAWADAAHRLHRRLERVLVDAGRWKDLGLLLADPAGEVRRNYRLVRTASEAVKDRFPWASSRTDPFLREGAARLYAGALAAGRQDAADAVVEVVSEFDRGTEATVALIEAALAAGEPRQVHVEWIDRAWPQPDRSAQLRERVVAGLKKRG